MFGPPGYHLDEAYQRVSASSHDLPQQAGIIPRAIFEIFNALRRGLNKEYSVYCSFVQIYNEALFDMLRDASRYNPLTIHEDPTSGIYVQVI